MWKEWKRARSTKPRSPNPLKRLARRSNAAGINIRGNLCGNKCLEGKTHCERHDPDNPPVVKKTKRNKRGSSGCTITHPARPLRRNAFCVRHGDMFDPNIVNPVICETIGPSGYTLRSKLKSLYETTARVTAKIKISTKCKC